MFSLYFATIFYCQFNINPIWRSHKSVLLNQRCWTFHFKTFPDILEPFKMRIFRWHHLASSFLIRTPVSYRRKQEKKTNLRMVPELTPVSSETNSGMLKFSSYKTKQYQYLVLVLSSQNHIFKSQSVTKAF